MVIIIFIIYIYKKMYTYILIKCYKLIHNDVLIKYGINIKKNFNF
jgi:hypothetical protein